MFTYKIQWPFETEVTSQPTCGCDVTSVSSAALLSITGQQDSLLNNKSISWLLETNNSRTRYCMFTDALFQLYWWNNLTSKMEVGCDFKQKETSGTLYLPSLKTWISEETVKLLLHEKTLLHRVWLLQIHTETGLKKNTNSTYSSLARPLITS